MKLLLALAAFAPGAEAAQRIIIETDMGLDIDDVAAVCMANAMHNKGEANVLAVMHNTGFAKGIGGISAINKYYGNDDILLGAYKGTFATGDCRGCGGVSGGQDQYLSGIINQFNPPHRDYTSVAGAVDVYKMALKDVPDKSVNVAQIGMSMNLRDCMKDSDCKTLFIQKVDTIVWMAPGYNFDCGSGLIDPNQGDCHAAARDAMGGMEHVRHQFTALQGWSGGIGNDIFTGKCLQQSGGGSNVNPCQYAFSHWGGPDGGGMNGRRSWDPVATLVAIKGDSASHARVQATGWVNIDEWGRTGFTGASGGNTDELNYACCNVQNDIQTEIDNALCHSPPLHLNITMPVVV